MNFKILSSSVSNADGEYKSGEISLQLPSHDFDIALELPDGEIITLQWRTEAPSLDICLENQRHLTAWKDGDLTPAEPIAHPNAMRVRQMCIDFPDSARG